jgi:hypothetical protein
MPLCRPVRALLLGLLLAAGAAPAPAQPEIVPAEHPVYTFLHQQRVHGRLPEYRHEWRPLGRGQIAALLVSVRVRTDGGRGLDGASAGWLRLFHEELHEPPGSIEAVFTPGEGGLRVPRGRDTRKFLLYHREPDWRVALSAIGQAQLRVLDEGTALYGVAFVPEGILEGNYRQTVGFYSGTFNGFTIGGDTRVLQADPQLAPLYYIGIAPVPQGNFDRSTASVRVANRTFSAEIAHARLIGGASFSAPVILSENADYFSFLRLGIDTRAVQYAFVHGALGEQSRFVEGDDGGGVLLGPQRYLALHRLTVNPWRWLQLAFTEAVVYGQRGPELAYLNPVYPLKPAEHALWDRDNANFALEAVVRPVAGVEAYGTFFATDLDTRRLGQGSYNNKWAWQVGVGGALGPALGWAEYTRVEPFMYTHRFNLDGSYYNSLTHNGFGLGHPLGPNADQWAAGLQTWLPGRLRGEVSARYVRRGENYVDPETGELVNVGGDIRDGRQPPFTEFTKRFLRGDRFEGPGASARLTWEPIRDIGLSLGADYQRGDRDPNRLFLRAEVYVAL